MPGTLVACFNHTVAAPRKGPMTKAQVIRLIAKLKKSEAAKSNCGKRLIRFYEAQVR